MEHDPSRKGVKIDPFEGNEIFDEGKEGGLSSVEKIRGYYDEARNRLKNYLGREEAAMGSGSSTPRSLDDGGGGGGGDGVGGVMFQQRPPHVRLEGKQVMGGEEFTDISYSDLGFIITPQSKKLRLNNNNCQRDENGSHDNCEQCSPSHSAHSQSEDHDLENDCDSMSSSVLEGDPGTNTQNSDPRSKLSSSTPNINFGNPNSVAYNEHPNRHSLGSLQHRGSDGSFTLSQMRASAKIRRGEAPDMNLDDLRLEEVTS